MQNTENTANTANVVMTEVRQLTIKELAAQMGEEYLTVSALVKLLVKIGAVKKCGKRANPEGTRCKPSTIYEIPRETVLAFWEDNEGEENAEVEAEAAPVVPAVTPETPVETATPIPVPVAPAAPAVA